MINKIYPIILFFFISIILKSTSLPKDNFFIIDSLIKISTNDLSNQIKNSGLKNVSIKINEHPAKWLVRQYLTEGLSKEGIEISESQNEYNIEINIKKAGLNYDYYENQDSLFRVFIVEISGLKISAEKKVDVLNAKSVSYTDLISKEDIDLTKSREYNFANAPVPEPNKTFFEEITGPVIAIGAAIITVLLLFSVRSG